MMTTTGYKLVATKDGAVVEEVLGTFKQLSKRHHQLARQGWEVSLPLK